jgi:cytidine deaminase
MEQVAKNTMNYTMLINAAQKARERAYVPYSGFAVGAAVLTASGDIFVGCNIENAAYPLTLCAERVALFSAYANGAQAITALAVVTPTESISSPCGGCRQVIIELAPRCVVLLLNKHGEQRQVSPQDLLPFSFGADYLDQAAQGD